MATGCSQKDLSVPLVIFFWKIAPSKGRRVFALTSEVNNRGLPKAMFWGRLEQFSLVPQMQFAKMGSQVLHRGTMQIKSEKEDR